MAKINGNNDVYAAAVFLGGTCGDTTWRRDLIAMLDPEIPFFDPQLGPGEWNDEAAAAETACKKEAKYQVYVIVEGNASPRSQFEAGHTAAKLGPRMIFAYLGDLSDKKDHLQKAIRADIGDMLEDGVIVCHSIEEVAAALNAAYAK
ncbi:hypothetical protein J6X15_00120 [Candidatus Saccharibacteria bacterium]|nr:hypothetical protein [Candidatus Saccharibacteria bacterium]